MTQKTPETAGAALVRKLAAECMLFLKKDDTFPLTGPCAVALFGNGARRTVRGGTGSGEVYSERIINMEDGLKENGFTVTTTRWMDEYERMYEKAHAEWSRQLRKGHRGLGGILSLMGSAMPEPEYDLSLDYPGDVCVYVLSRISGEGIDRQFRRGDILLSKTEIRDILALRRKFEKFLLVLNVGGPVDLSEVEDVENILLFSQVGPSSGDILADILLGVSDPCGKLATTWARTGDYCTIGQFGQKDDTRYLESIYVGYRYFDSVGRKARYPFGFGMSYTEFSLGQAEVSVSGTVVTARVPVTNTGSRPGREVVQAYVSVPEQGLDQPYQVLAAFDKTEVIGPGRTGTAELSFDMTDLASWSTEDAWWILEYGDYVLRIGNSSVNTEPAAVLCLGETVMLLGGRNVLGDCGFPDWKPDPRPVIPEIGVPHITVDASAFSPERVCYDRQETVEPFAGKLSDEELCCIGIGRYSKNPMSIVGNASLKVAGAAGDFTDRLTDRGFPVAVTADGPAGLRLERAYYRDDKGIHNVHNDMVNVIGDMLPGIVTKALTREKKIPAGAQVMRQDCTMIPTATALAQSFDVRLAERMGDLVGGEMERYDVDFWLAPALNIHRDIRCGRNFEYYSEDPLLSGLMAAAVVRGVQSHPGRHATIKHYAANNQETNRYNNNSQVTERAMREIYLKGFGICVRQSRPDAVMTSYNLLNGTHTACHRGLIEDILRCEFGFDGIVMTDWVIRMAMKGGKYPMAEAWEIAAAGGDVLMPGSKADFDSLREGLKSGKVSRRQLEENASRMYRVVTGKN